MVGQIFLRGSTPYRHYNCCNNSRPQRKPATNKHRVLFRYYWGNCFRLSPPRRRVASGACCRSMIPVQRALSSSHMGVQAFFCARSLDQQSGIRGLLIGLTRIIPGRLSSSPFETNYPFWKSLESVENRQIALLYAKMYTAGRRPCTRRPYRTWDKMR